MNLHRLIPVVVMTASLLLPALCRAADAAPRTAPAPVAQPLPDPVARVNGAPIAAADLERAYTALASSQGAHIPPGQEQAARKYVLNQLISAEMMYQMAQKTTVPDLNKKIDDSLAHLRGRFKNDDEFRKGLAQQGLTEKELRELIRRNVVIENYIKQTIADKVTVTDQEAKAFYDKNPETFTLPEQVRASHILITVDPKASVADKKKARVKAEDILKKLQAGADFATLAKEYSGCPSSKQGGDLGYFSKGQMVKPFEDAAWALKPGQLSGVVETQFGYHIIKLTERRGATKIPFSAVKAKIEENLKERKIGEQVNAALEAAKKSAKIEINLK